MRAVKVLIDTHILGGLLGLDVSGIEIRHAQVSNDVYERPALQLILVGPNLPDYFEIQEGESVKTGDIIVHVEYRTAEIRPV